MKSKEPPRIKYQFPIEDEKLAPYRRWVAKKYWYHGRAPHMQCPHCAYPIEAAIVKFWTRRIHGHIWSDARASHLKKFPRLDRMAKALQKAGLEIPKVSWDIRRRYYNEEITLEQVKELCREAGLSPTKPSRPAGKPRIRKKTKPSI